MTRRLDPAAGLPQPGRACWSSRSRSRASSPRPTVPVNPFEQIADHRAAADDARQPPGPRRAHRALRRPAGAVGQRHRQRHARRASSSSASSPTPPARRHPGRDHHRRRLRRADRASSPTRAPTSWSTSCSQENVKLRTGRAGDTLEFFQAEVDRLAGELERRVDRRSPSSRPRTSRRCPTAWRRAATSRSVEQERLIDARARGIRAQEPARHRGLGVRAHRALGHRRPRSAPRRSSCRR